MWRALAIMIWLCSGIPGLIFGQLINPDYSRPADLPRNIFSRHAPQLTAEEAQDNTLQIAEFAGNTATLYGEHHKLAVQQTDDTSLLTPKPRKKEEDWKVLFLLGGLIAIAAARYYYASRLWHFFKAASGTNFFNQMEREGGFFDELITYLLFFNFVVVFSLLIWQTILFFSPETTTSHIEPFVLFLALLVIAIAFYATKSLLLGLLGWVFNTQQATQAYLKNLFLFNQLTGLALLPAVGYLAYSPSHTGMVIIWGFWLAANLFKIFRGALIGYGQLPYSGYYLFLYLCGVELVPVLLIIKFGSKYLLVS